MKLKPCAAVVVAAVVLGVNSGAWIARAQLQPTAPVITFVGDSASYSGYIAWGELVTIFGTNLSDGGTYQAQTVPLPTQLGATQVFSTNATCEIFTDVCTLVSLGEPLELLYVSPTQINLRMSTSSPPQNCQNVAGQCVDLAVKVGSEISPVWDNGYALYAPALFSSGFDCPYLGWPNAGATNVSCGLSPTQKPGQFPRPIVTDSNYSLVTNNNPARLGQPYVLWLTGLGNPGYTGDLRSKFPTLRAELSRCCLPAYFDGLAGDASVLYAGASSEFPGLYQLNFALPSLAKSAIGYGTDCGSALEIEVWLSVVANAVSAGGGGTGSNYLSIPVYVSASENPCAAATTLTSSPNPSAPGQVVAFTASVAPASATGTVTFIDGTSTLGSATLSAGVATFSNSSLSLGSHSITATYGGDSDHGGSSATLTQTVSEAPSTTTLTSVPNPSTFGQTVTLTASVSPSAATGTVTFSELTCSPAPCSVHPVVLGSGTLKAGKATLSTSSLSADAHSIKCTYSGDANYAGSGSATVVQTVGKTPTSMTVTSSPNPSVAGQTVTFTIIVSPSTATGFVSGIGACLNVSLSSGQAMCSTVLALGPGAQSITFNYSGDSNYTGSTASLVQAIKQNTATTLTSSLNPSAHGQSVTFTALMYFSNATGTMTFLDGSTTLGSSAVSKAQATFSTSALSTGSHSITAVYSGDTNHGGSTSAVLTQIVN